MAQPTTIKSGDPRNDVTPVAPRKYSTFNLSHRFLQTHRFGEITPCESFETFKGCRDSFRLQSDTSSYSLKAPIKTDMFQKHSNFFVPLQAIIPNGWELVTAQPSNGDDVPDDVDGFVSADILNQFFTELRSKILSGTDSMGIPGYLTWTLRNMLLAEMFFSQGSLLKQLYYDFSHCVVCEMESAFGKKYVSFDRFLDHFLSKVAPVGESGEGIYNFTVAWYDEDQNVTDKFLVVSDEDLSENPTLFISDNALQKINFRHCLDLMRQNLNFIIEDAGASFVDEFDPNSIFFEPFYFAGSGEDEPRVHFDFVRPLAKGINFDKISAYQICCAHFFSLDHVDYIYSAELYRQMMRFFFLKTVNSVDGVGLQTITYNWNGLQLEYDALSGYAIHYQISGFLDGSFWNDFDDIDAAPWTPFASYMTALFSFRHSLRYLDYFTGGRTQPLSVGTQFGDNGQINVPVVNNSVNGVEVIMAQNAARYLNFAQRAGRKISQWLDKLFPGGAPKPDYHDPQWLSTTGDALNPEQVQNTGAAQAEEANSITARFKNDSNRYMFTVLPDRPGYVICVTYYDIPRSYAFATAKENFVENRYDRFNPFFQYNGSQKVDSQELGLAGDAPFSYQGRYEQYKQNYDICAGGFVENLPGFAFIADVQSGLPMQKNLNPTYVRSWNTELDPFYLALTGYGLASYFHFIVKNVNILECQRPMEYAPQLM